MSSRRAAPVLIAKESSARTFLALLTSDPCEPEACVPFVRNAMDVLNKVVISAAEKRDLEGGHGDDQLPAIGIHELRLRPSDVDRIVAAFKSVLPGIDEQAQEEGDAYTVSFIVAPGRVSEFF